PLRAVPAALPHEPRHVRLCVRVERAARLPTPSDMAPEKAELQTGVQPIAPAGPGQAVVQRRPARAVGQGLAAIRAELPITARHMPGPRPGVTTGAVHSRGPRRRWR